MESMCVLSIVLIFVFVFQMLNQVVNGVVLFHGGHLWHCSPPFSTPHNHKTLYFVFCILYFAFCNLYFKCSPPPSHSVQPQDCFKFKSKYKDKEFDYNFMALNDHS